MRLPGTRYQEHGWEQVRKMLGLCSLAAFAHASPARLLDPGCRPAALSEYVDHTSGALRATWRSARAETPANSYGESVLELALGLLFELQARPADWDAFAVAVENEHGKIGAFWDQAGGDAILRKKVNDMYAVLRDKVDSDNYQVACGRSCSPNKMYAYRMIDTAYGDIARIFDAWRQHPGQVGAILGREVGAAAAPIEVRQMKSIAGCKPEWVINWSESRERFTGAPGPLHTRSKRFASLKHCPDRIGAMLREIGDYEELSANRDCDWQQDGVDAAGWLDDLARVLDEAEREPDVSPAPGYMNLMSAAGPMAGQSLPVRLAVYLKMLGAHDDSYPAEWLDPVTGELPTMQQLAMMDQVSLPTLRKRRDAAIATILGAQRP